MHRCMRRRSTAGSQEALSEERQVVTRPPLSSLQPSPSPSQIAIQTMLAHYARTYQGADNRLVFIGKFLSISEYAPTLTLFNTVWGKNVSNTFQVITALPSIALVTVLTIGANGIAMRRRFQKGKNQRCSCVLAPCYAVSSDSWRRVDTDSESAIRFSVLIFVRSAFCINEPSSAFSQQAVCGWT